VKGYASSGRLSMNKYSMPKMISNKHVYIICGAFISACTSVLLQEFHYGISNNIFHIPVVLKSFDRSNFLDDAFYQSLRVYTSYVWTILSTFTNEGNIKLVFVMCHIFSRWLFLASIMAIGYQFGLKDKWRLLGIAGIFVFSRMFYGYTAIAKSGLFIDYFTHTELTYPFILLAFLLASKGRSLYAFLVNAIAFNINAFVSVWGGFVLVVDAILRSRAGTRGRSRLILTGIMLSGVVALPTLIWIVTRSAGFHGSGTFSYVNFLRLYFPFHFFIESALKRDILDFIFCATSGFFALLLLPKTDFHCWRSWFITYLSLIVLFIMGAGLPMVTGNRFLLNLHIMRVDAVIQTLALLFIGVVALYDSNWFRSFKQNNFYGVPIFCALAIGNWAAVAPAILAAYALAPDRHYFAKKLVCAFFVMLAFLFPCVPRVFPNPGIVSLYVGYLLLCGGICLASACACSSLPMAALSAVFVGLCTEGASNYNLAAGLFFLAGTLWPEEDPPWVRRLMTTVAIGVGLFGITLNCNQLTLFVGTLQVACCVVFFLHEKVRISGLGRLGALPVWAAMIFLLLGPLSGKFLLICRPNPILAFNKCWQEARYWVRDNTPEQSVFLVPLHPDGFQLEANRQVWVDSKQGAAVMWYPSFFFQWYPRFSDVQKLASFEDWRTYACTHGVDYLVFGWPEGKTMSDYMDITPEPVFRNEVCAIYPKNALCNEPQNISRK